MEYYTLHTYIVLQGTADLTGLSICRRRHSWPDSTLHQQAKTQLTWLYSPSTGEDTADLTLLSINRRRNSWPDRTLQKQAQRQLTGLHGLYINMGRYSWPDWTLHQQGKTQLTWLDSTSTGEDTANLTGLSINKGRHSWPDWTLHQLSKLTKQANQIICPSSASVTTHSDVYAATDALQQELHH